MPIQPGEGLLGQQPLGGVALEATFERLLLGPEGGVLGLGLLVARLQADRGQEAPRLIEAGLLRLHRLQPGPFRLQAGLDLTDFFREPTPLVEVARLGERRGEPVVRRLVGDSDPEGLVQAIVGIAAGQGVAFGILAGLDRLPMGGVDRLLGLAEGTLRLITSLLGLGQSSAGLVQGAIGSLGLLGGTIALLATAGRLGGEVLGRQVLAAAIAGRRAVEPLEPREPLLGRSRQRGRLGRPVAGAGLDLPGG